ncbi:methylated-DNA--[protein]-cysteine S-methyltransferase [Chitiniphilus eburneus]|uniref:methylated-DNA--[protein]-cysteine S-methyltransferase n=2 Tax=Chitiniphilus eburneus TaxID=2571148 RepID=A0A4U0PWU3_9NEIS|nr:methylated-DNA--[protein]-cysteine S-methyltransferase [Chitiniphilus eburneus]
MPFKQQIALAALRILRPSARRYLRKQRSSGKPPWAYRGTVPHRSTTMNTETRLYYALGPCDLGLLLVAQGEHGARAILLGDDGDSLLRDLRARFPMATPLRDDAACATLLGWVAGFIAAPAQPLAIALDPRGTPFQLRVWQALREIPPGQTASYGEIARRIGAPTAARAVAAACAANPLAVVIPCHRVVRGDGGLSGYRWGAARKRALLAREAA